MLLIEKNDTFKTNVYRKPTNKGIYLHWNSFAPETWKRGTLRSIIKKHIISVPMMNFYD